MIFFTSCLYSGWAWVEKGNSMDSTKDNRRLISSSVSGLLGIFHVPGWDCRRLLTVIWNGFSTSPQTIFVITKWFLVLGYCQIHLRFSSNVVNFLSVLLWKLVYSFPEKNLYLHLLRWRVEKKFSYKRKVLWLFGALESDFFCITNSFCQYFTNFGFWVVS